MGVTVTNTIEIQDLEGNLHQGVAIVDGLYAVKVGDETRYGLAKRQVSTHTVITCDSPFCDSGKFNEKFELEPGIIEFDDYGDGNLPAEAWEVANLVSIKGEKKVFCRPSCMAGYLRRKNKLDGSNVIQFPVAKKYEPAKLLVPDRS